MEINQEKCTRCTKCMPYCPVGAIKIDRVKKQIYIDYDECVECESCFRAGVCEPEALVQSKLTWPRTVRSSLSNPLVNDPETRIPGRGTEEIKTNDVTGRLRPGYVGMAIEMGRPGISTSMRDIEKVTKAMTAIGVELEPLNPITRFIKDKSTGSLDPELINERVLSGIIEFGLPIDRMPEVIKELDTVAKELDTVFSFGISSIVERDGDIPLLDALDKMGLSLSINGKTNVGLGKPLFDFWKEKE